MAKCMFCGSELIDGAAFCGSCGAAIPAGSFTDDFSDINDTSNDTSLNSASSFDNSDHQTMYNNGYAQPQNNQQAFTDNQYGSYNQYPQYDQNNNYMQGYSANGQYQSPYYGSSTRNNQMCTIGLIIGVVSLVFTLCGITGVIGIIVSSIGLKQVKETGESGRGLGIAGLVTSCISVGFLVIALGFAILISMVNVF